MERKRWWREPGLVFYIAGWIFYLALSVVHGDPKPNELIGFAIGVGGGWLIGFILPPNIQQVFPPIAAAIRGERRWDSIETLGMAWALVFLAAVLVAKFPNDAAFTTGTFVAAAFGNRKRSAQRTRF
jgi:purine-cytosine permease-like protein